MTSNSSIKELLEKGEYDKIIDIIKYSNNLEDLKLNSHLRKLFSCLESKLQYERITEIIIIFSKYKKPVYMYEIKEGIRLLLAHHKISDIIDIMDSLQTNGKFLDDDVTLSILNACLNSQSNIDKLFPLLLTYIKLNKSLTNLYWQNLIEFFIKNNYTHLALEIIKTYPVKFTSAETLWKIIIKSNMSDASVLNVFEILKEKYKNKDKTEDPKVYVSIFNIFFEELSASYQEIDKKKIETIYDYLLIQKEIELKEKNLENFLVKILLFYHNDFEKVETFLIKSGDRLSPKILESLIKEYHKIGDSFSIYSLIRITKLGKLNINYSQLNLPAEVLKEIVVFLIENTEINFEDSFYDKLSVENKSYIDRFYKPDKLLNDLENDHELIPHIKEKEDFINQEYAIY